MIAVLGPALVLCVVGARIWSGPVSAVLLALVSGALWGVFAVLTKGVVDRLDDGLWALLRTPELYVWALVAIAGTAWQQSSFRAGALTASNSQGSTAQTSAAANVKAAKIKLTTKKKAKADAGDLVAFKVKAVNQGDLAAKKGAKLCVKLPKAAKDDLKAPKCKKLGLKGRGKKTLTLKVKVKPAADEGTDKLTFQVKGSAGKAAKSKIVVG